jgi:hypothetical protein
LVLNENGMAVNYQIVPNDKRDFVKKLLEEIWRTEDSNVVPSVVYTDNPKVDSSIINETFSHCFPEDPTGVEVLLDIYHAKVRVLREMNKHHPDYAAAKSDLTSIFALIQVRGQYDTIGDLRNTFDDWTSKYSKVYASTMLTTAEKISYLAEITKR